MLFLGHIAASLLIADKTESDRTTAVIGNLVPDVVDKSASLLRLSPARWLAHGLPFYLLALIVARVVYVDDRRWRGFALGYAGHLLCDLWGGSRVPWFAPFQSQLKRRRRRKRTWRRWFVYLVPEVIGGAYLWRCFEDEMAPGPGSK